MTKKDVAMMMSKISPAERRMSPDEAEASVELFIESVKRIMARGYDIYLRGFGAFKVVKRAEKKCRDIGRNKFVIVPAHLVPHFKPYDDFVNLMPKPDLEFIDEPKTE